MELKVLYEGVSEADALHAAREVLWMLGDQRLGWRPGSFITHVLNAMGAADPVNMVRLRLAFPEYAVPYLAAMQEPDGLAALRVAVMDADDPGQAAFDRLQAEARDAAESYKAARARQEKASSDLRGAQCWAAFKTTPGQGSTRVTHCTLRHGHAGGHANEAAS